MPTLALAFWGNFRAWQTVAANGAEGRSGIFILKSPML